MIIRNKGFRIFLYILGYISCTAVIALSIVTALRYTTFKDDIGNTQAYAETSSVRYWVYNVLTNLQTEAKSRQEWENSKLADASVDLFDYTTGAREAAPLSELAKKDGFTDVLSGLKNSAGIWENAQNGMDWEVPETFYDDTNTLNGSSCFLKIRTDDFVSLIKNQASVYSMDKLDRYFDLQNTLTAEPGTALASEAKEEFSLYEQLVRNNYTDYLSDGDYFVLLDSGIFICSPGQMYVRRLNAQKIDYEFFLNSQGSSLLYVALPENFSSLKKLSADKSQEVIDAVFTGILYHSPLDAFYSSLNDEQRTLIRSSSDLSAGMYVNANAAYSFGNDEISGLEIWDPRGISEARDLSADNGSYEKLAALISENADVFIRYDHKSNTLTQWYLDPSGNRHDYHYLESIDALANSGKDSFVLGMRLYDSFSDNFVFENFVFDLCKAIPSPALLLVISAVVFLLCVVLLLIGVPAKLLSIDRVPFGILLILYLVLLFLIGWVLPHELGRSIFSLLQKDLAATIAIILLIILALYVMTAALFTTIARRIKCKCFVKSLLVVLLGKQCIRAARFLGRKLSRGRERFTQNYEKALSGHKRLIVFASVLFAVNAILLLIFGMMHGGAVLFSFLVIVAEAYAGYHLLKYSAGVDKVLAVSRQIEAGDLEAKTDPEELSYNVKELGESLNQLGTGLSKAVESSIRDERTKAELITNVSHDIKTPLTSIISYVDLLKNEPIENERAKEYIKILDQKSQRLKQLIMDLIEVSKTNTGNIELERTNLNLTELLDQVMGEYEEKLAACELEPILSIQTEQPVIYADGRRVFRIIDNLFNNVVKYAQPGTRVYINLTEAETSGSKRIALSVKNVSREMLNISAEELTERFVRGDRARHTEGSGLGLSIAKNLTELQDGTFRIDIDGDLFKVEVAFPAVSR